MNIAIPVASDSNHAMNGSATVEWNAFSEGLEGFARSKKIDTTHYYPVSLALHVIEPNYFTLYAADMAQIGQGPDTIISYDKAHDGVIPVVLYKFDSFRPFLFFSVPCPSYSEGAEKSGNARRA